jgi:peptide/nickel transport system substrate-binding protein
VSGFDRRSVLLACLAGLGVTVLARPRAGAATPQIQPVDTHHPVGVDRPEGGRVILDPTQFPRTFQESPVLAALVRQGRLPPIRERIGQDPLVIAPLQEIGRYGGTLRRAFIGPGDQTSLPRFSAGPDSFLYWDYEWQTLLPNIARGFEFSHDNRTLTLFLRRGMRWSDGAPFTADDVLFWYEDLYRDRRVVSRPSANLKMDDEEVRIEKVDAATVQFVAPKSYPLLGELLAGYTDIAGPSVYGRFAMGGFAPKHYLSQFHARYRSEAEVRRAAHEAGFANWALYLKNRNDSCVNPELPVVTPWRVVSPINTQVFALERNPYSIWVDTAGNQLPYIDRIRHSYASGPDAINFMACAGELDFQDRHLNVSKLPFLLVNRRRSNYEVYLDPMQGTDLGLRINLSYREDPYIGGLLGNAGFRRALSLGIDRDAINESFMLGTGSPSATVPIPGSRYFPGPEWVHRWATLDVERANQLLDGLGLRSRDTEGFRQRADGGGRLRLVCECFLAHFDYPAVAEVVKEQWRLIGVDLRVQIVDDNLWFQRCQAGIIQTTLQSTDCEDPLTFPEKLFPFSIEGPAALTGLEFARWFQSSGTAGRRPPTEIMEMMNLWRKAREAGNEERIQLGREIIRRHVDLVLTVGLISGGLSSYGIRVAKTRLGNVPRRVINSLCVRAPLNALPMTFFYR